MPSQDLQRFERFLLGDLPETEREALEERLLGDADLFLELELAEEELIDSYVRGELVEADRRRFEATCGTSPRIAQRLKFASQLAEQADHVSTERARAQPPPAKPAPVSAWQRLLDLWRQAGGPLQLAAATALVLAIGVPLYLELARTPAKVVSIVLSPASVRGTRTAEEVEPAVVERGAVRLELFLETDEPGNSPFEVVITDAAGTEVRRQGGLGVQQLDWGRAVVLELALEPFQTGTPFEIRLLSEGAASEEVATFELLLERP